MANNNYIEMLCPICGQYEFADDTEEEKSSYESDIEADWCPYCGWIYDLNQVNNPFLKNGKNKLSLSEYREWYKEKIKENPNYDYSEDNFPPIPHKCPVCGIHEFSDDNSFEICPECGWIDDALMEESPKGWEGCSNDLCLVDYKTRYEKLKQDNPKYKYKKNGYDA